MHQNTRIGVLAVGGTIDKIYAEGKGVENYSFAEDPAAIDILRRMRVTGLIPVSIIDDPKDSLNMNESDRINIAGWCLDCDTEGIVVTHGTDTMIDTAEAIAKLNLGKTIVLTGASQPASMRVTDAEANVGFALAAAKLAPHGVYIAMNGELYIWHECVKVNSGTFARKTNL